MSNQISIEHFLQDKDWNNDLLNSDEEVLCEDIVFNNVKSGVILAVKKKVRFLPYNYLRITFGPTLDYSSAAILAYALDQIIDISRRSQSVYVQVNPFTWGDQHSAIVKQFEQRGFKKTKRYIYEATIMLDLTKSETELLQEFERRGREAVRQSERRGISSLQAEITTNNLECFYTMYAETCKRSGMIADEKAKIFNRSLYFGKKGKAFLFFASYLNKPVCGFLAFKCGNCLSLIYQGSDYSGDLPNRRPANNLYWNTILWAKKMGFKWFDLAGVTINSEKGSKSEGIFLYKRQFGGRICILPGNFEFTHRPFIKFILDICGPVYSKAALFLPRKRSTF